MDTDSMTNAPVTPLSDEITPDPDDEGFDEDIDLASSRTSLASRIRNGILENGRRYAAYGSAAYGLPGDEDEMDRQDMAHEKYFILLGDKKYLAPIGDDVKNVLDLGTGSGIWSMDFADAHPSAEVIGVDLAPTQPGWVPPNCRFDVDDIEATWTFKNKNHFDFIFSRDLYFSIRDFPKLIRQCFDYCKPGGYVEFECVYGIIGCDDGTIEKSRGFLEYDRVINEAARVFGTPLGDAGRFKEWFEATGFQDVTERKFKLPCSPWPKDPRLKWVGAFERENLGRNIQSMSMRVLQNGVGMSPDAQREMMSRVLDDIKNPAIHAYYPLYVTYGRKPLDAVSQ